LLTKVKISDFQERVKIQRDRIRRGEYQHLGMLSVISLEKEKGQQLPADQARVIGRVIDLMDKRVPLGISPDMQDLLLYAGFPRELPDIVDPNYPGRMTLAEKTPFIRQTWADRASGETHIAGADMIVAQPVCKLILVGDPLSPFGKLGWPMIHCDVDSLGRHTMFLFNPLKVLATRRGSPFVEAFIVGGRFQFSTRGVQTEGKPALASA
jgi:hypothetical protein